MSKKLIGKFEAERNEKLQEIKKQGHPQIVLGGSGQI